MNKREQLSVQMRHSPHIAQRAYFKIKTDDKATSKDDNAIIQELKQTIESLKIENNELKVKLSEVLPNEDDKLYKKRKADIVARFKKGLPVKHTTLEKYNIKQPIK